MNIIDRILHIGLAGLNSVVVDGDSLSKVDMFMNVLNKYTNEYRDSENLLTNVRIITYRMTYYRHLKMLAELRFSGLKLESDGSFDHVKLVRIW